MAKLQSVTVTGLFGSVEHFVHVEPINPTVITGPNGTGKTHVLRLIDATLGSDVRYLLDAPFERINLKFIDGFSIAVSRSTQPRPLADSDNRIHGGELVTLLFSSQAPNHLPREASTNSLEFERDKAGDSRNLPSYIVQLGSGRYYDTRLERPLPQNFVESRYGSAGHANPLQGSAAGRAYLASIRDLKSVLIDTKRLDSEFDSFSRTGAERRASEGEERILGYIRQIQAEVAAARDDSLHRSQSADLRFGDRALAAATSTVRLEDLKQQYSRVVALYEEMARNGLAPDETPAGVPEKPNPTAKRIMALLLEDWNQRLTPLSRINQKLTDLRSILDSKIGNSGKRTFMGSRGRLGIESVSGRRIPVARLSSGEQHLLAIFSQLLFATQPGSIVLIDEPEISMHMSWQHSFLEDVKTVAATSDLQIIIATHSTGIINGQWGFVRELLLPLASSEADDFGGESFSKDAEEDD